MHLPTYTYLLHLPARPCTYLHAPARACTRLHAPARTCTHLHAPARTCAYLPARTCTYYIQFGKNRLPSVLEYSVFIPCTRSFAHSYCREAPSAFLVSSCSRCRSCARSRTRWRAASWWTHGMSCWSRARLRRSGAACAGAAERARWERFSRRASARPTSY